MSKPPNILFLMSDEHRFDTIGYAGNAIVRTPCLDELSKEAVIFDQAYTPSPVCIPARQCMAAGQYSNACNVKCFGEDLEPNYQTFARVLTEHNYKTVAVGKLHHHGIDQMQGWQIRIAGDMQVSVNHYLRQSQKPPSAPDILNTESKWDEKKEIMRAGPGESAYLRKDYLAITGCKDFIYEHFVDSYYDRAEPNIPLLLYLGLINPHYPYIAPKQLFDYYLNRVELLENVTVSSHPYLGKCPGGSALMVGKDVRERDVKRAMAAYYANIETVDTQFGEIIQSLRDAGEDLDEWIIIYTSDHGEMLGEHAIWEKRKFYEGSVRVPLFIRYPKRFTPKTIHQNVNLIDLFATICELCEIEIPENLQSRSLVELLSGKTDNWDNETISQLDGTNLMIKRDALKYHWYEEDQSELLFDLEKDPQENHDVSKDSAYKRKLETFQNRRMDFGFA
ncbi:MAG: sulfatase-like hydrolase/transferase [Clostridium sp.]